MFITIDKLDEIFKTYAWVIPLLSIILSFLPFIFNFWSKINPVGSYKLLEFQKVLSESKKILNQNDYIFCEKVVREKTMFYFTDVDDKKLREQMVYICKNTNISFFLLKKVKKILVLNNEGFNIRITLGYLLFRFMNIAYGAIVFSLALMCSINAMLNFITYYYLPAFISYIMALALGVWSLYLFTKYPSKKNINKINSQLALIDMKNYYENYIYEYYS